MDLIKQYHAINPLAKDYKEYTITHIELKCLSCGCTINIRAIPLIVDYKQEAEYYKELAYRLQVQFNQFLQNRNVPIIVDKLPDDIKKVQ